MSWNVGKRVTHCSSPSDRHADETVRQEIADDIAGANRAFAVIGKVQAAIGCDRRPWVLTLPGRTARDGRWTATMVLKLVCV